MPLERIPPRVVLLGAGRPYRGAPPSALQQTPDQRVVLDWILDAFSGMGVSWHFVGGYHLRDVVRRYPDIEHSVNVDWETTGSAASLFSAAISSDRTHYVVYTDVVFGNDVVQRLAADDSDVVLAVDRTWRRRYTRRRPEEMRLAEKARLDHERVLTVASDVPIEKSDAEFTGLLKLSPAAMERLLHFRSDERERYVHAGIPDLVNALVESGMRCTAVDVEGRWAELNAPQDLARFVLGTKAETLERLRPLLRHGAIGDQVAFSVTDWRAGRRAVLARVREKFSGPSVVVRSSTLAEDSWSTANAGVFLSVADVPLADLDELGVAIDRVVASFSQGNPDDQVLIQEMLRDVALSGVAFTRSLSSGAPYYVINYDDTTGSTESVTGGTGRDLKTLVVHRQSTRLPEEANPRLSRLLHVLRELEVLVGHDSLDVEFAVGLDDVVHVLQVRPIAVDHRNWRVSDRLINEVLDVAKRDFQNRQARTPFLAGERTVFGIMPDWNPAEIVGTKPRRLALSLYRQLITDEVWAASRAEFGYRDVRPAPLLVCFAGHPYIDVRASFSSFVPAEIDNSFADRLVDSYLRRLESSPHLHDKIEFEIAFTCLTFDFDAQAERLRADGFSQDENEQLRQALRRITRQSVTRYEHDLNRVACAERRFQALQRANLPPLALACALLEDSKRCTLPFSSLARGAFVATALLRSAVEVGILDGSELHAFLGSLNTVARQFSVDGSRVARRELSWDDYVARYGHLRPGTYEITSACYAEDPERYLRPMTIEATTEHQTQQPAFEWSNRAHKTLVARLRDLGVLTESEGIETFDAFCRGVIEGRESSKFAFTRNLSAALEAVARFGIRVGLTREQLSHVCIEDLQSLRVGMAPADAVSWLHERAEDGQAGHALAQAIELPPLLTSVDHLDAFVYPESRPNFVSLGRVTAEVADLTHEDEAETSIEGRIALIPQADPGYDWLFGQSIVGLITMYGGANSHMAIRAAEFALPAAIGVGESLYAKYRNANVLELDCAGRHIRVLR